MTAADPELVACTLTDADLKKQRARWLDLRAKFGLGHEEMCDGLTLAFTDHPAFERELRALVAVENECCGWAAWSVERDKGILVMAARSKGEGIAALRAMFLDDRSTVT